MSGLGDFASVLAWISHIWLGIPALLYPIGGIMSILDGAAKLAMSGGVDPVLKEAEITTKEKVYETLKNTDDASRQLALYSMLLLRNWGSFEVAASAACWCVIFMVPVHMRAAPHFIMFWLRCSIAMNDASTQYSFPWGADTVAKLGGVTKGQVAVVDVDKNNVRPAVLGSLVSHAVFGIVDLIIAILCLAQGSVPTKYSPPF
eukprot:TRINITY_DN79009_c0_g1_i1.p1 TRINITY_DN79009_c0_g1~~TRINITY_DN79009_c0_g1_i1.p1  ORF type:complete len:203 (+),score=32.93 TRINITY_DN79009_c0_g1_i1:63-671(+)